MNWRWVEEGAGYEGTAAPLLGADAMLLVRKQLYRPVVPESEASANCKQALSAIILHGSCLFSQYTACMLHACMGSVQTCAATTPQGACTAAKLLLLLLLAAS